MILNSTADINSAKSMEHTFIICRARDGIPENYNDNCYALGLPIDMPHLKAQFFVMDGEDLGLYCFVKGTNPFPAFTSSFLANYGKFLCFTASPNHILKQFLFLYPEALSWGEKVEVFRSSIEDFDPTDPTLFRVDEGISSFIRSAINLDEAYFPVLLSRDERFKSLFKSVYINNGGKRAEIWEKLSIGNYRADFINLILLLPDSLDAVDSNDLFIKFSDSVDKWLEEVGNK